MKATIIVLLIGIAIALNIGIKRESGAKKPSSAAAQSSVRTVYVGLAGINSSNERKLTSLLRTTSGVKNFQIDPEKKRARIEIDLQKTNLADLFESIRNIGITAWL